jgi:hypothetical protein
MLSKMLKYVVYLNLPNIKEPQVLKNLMIKNRPKLALRDRHSMEVALTNPGHDQIP